jgi:dodecin
MSVYRVTEIIGTSGDSWEDAARQALQVASGSLRDLRVAEVMEQDITLSAEGRIESFRTKLRVSFKYEAADERSQRASAGAARAVEPAE